MFALVSVVIPTFNRVDVVGRAVESALGQTHHAVEVIVVDDGSDDGTGAMLQARFGADPRLVVLTQDNRGVCGARNAGLDRASGAFVAFLDSDDVWLPWKLEVQLACLAHRPEVGMLWTDMQAIGVSGDLIHPRFLRRMYPAFALWSGRPLFEATEAVDAFMPDAPPAVAGTLVRWGRVGRAMMLGNLVHTSTVLMRRSRLDAVGRFDETLAPAGEDHDFHLRVCQAGPVGLLDVASILYQTGRPDRLTLLREVMARNYLQTMERAIQAAAPQERPPARALRIARARGHAWLGGVLLGQGDTAEARRHLVRSLWHQPLQARPLMETAATLLPRPLYKAALRLLRRRRRTRPTLFKLEPI